MTNPSFRNIRPGLERLFEIAGVSTDDPYILDVTDGSMDAYDRFCRAILRPEHICLDIGANIGFTSLIESDIVTSGKVFAFEPGERVYAALKANIERNKAFNVVPIHAAVSNRTGTVCFEDNSAYGHITNSGKHVRCTSVDTIVEELKLDRLDYVKIDVEGHEENVLRGARRAINKFSPLIHVEFNSWCLIAFSETHPRLLLEYIFDNFKYVGKSAKTMDDPIFVPMDRDQIMNLLIRNFFYDRFINDIVATNDPERLPQG